MRCGIIPAANGFTVLPFFVPSPANGGLRTRQRILKFGKTDTLSWMDEPTIRYTQGDTVVLWKPKRCIHSGICVRGLPAVFNIARRPWVDMLGAVTLEIRNQVDKCPSGALSWEENKAPDE